MEASNVKAIREALSDACYAMFNFLKTKDGGYEEMAEALDKAKAALAGPPRNCDVGTAEEQSKRFVKFCQHLECKDCQLHNNDERFCECVIRWSQMPYEEVK